MGRRRICALDETRLAVSRDTPWRDRQGRVIHDLLWHFDGSNLPGLLASAFVAEAGQAWADWCTVADLRIRRTEDASQAHILMTTGRIDGPGGTLAWSNLPPTSPCRQLYDAGERSWSDERGNGINARAVICHEGGHALGLLHADQSSGDLMAPYYRKGVYQPRPGDVTRIRKLYGKPKEQPGDPGDADGKPFIIRIWAPQRIEVEGPQGPYRVIPAW